METLFRPLLEKWRENVILLNSHPEVLVLSKKGLSPGELSSLQRDFLEACGDRFLSVILSLKMMHSYFKVGTQTYDYRPHRGPFSGLVISDYHRGKSDRVEVLIDFSSAELEKFKTYANFILKSRSGTLGEAYPLSLREPNFTCLSHETRGLLSDNRLINSNDRHNCLSWFTTAPLGADGESVLNLLKMDASDLKNECHSYIVAFYKFLVSKGEKARVPGAVWWTGGSLDESIERIRLRPDFIQTFYTV